MAQTDRDDGREKVLSLVSKAQVCMMATHAGPDVLHSRPMVAQHQERDADLWFFTDAGSRKVREIEANPRVLLDYCDPSGQNYISILGDAHVVHDARKAKELWSEGMRVWFPKGPDNPGLALIRVDAKQAEYWDSSSSAMIHAYGYLKAVATGERPNPGDVGKVTL
jgi:general stress protein 26